MVRLRERGTDKFVFARIWHVHDWEGAGHRTCQRICEDPILVWMARNRPGEGSGAGNSSFWNRGKLRIGEVRDDRAVVQMSRENFSQLVLVLMRHAWNAEGYLWVGLDE